MTFDCSVLWDAIGAAGMLLDAVYHPTSGDDVPLQVGFVQPDLDVASGLVQSAEYKIEFQTAEMPSAKMGELIDVDGSSFKMRAHPEKRGNGYFSTVSLTKL